MDDGRTGHDQRLAARLAILGQFVGDSADGQLLGFFGRDGAVHEPEGLGVAGALFGKDADAGMADHDHLSDRTSFIGTQRAVPLDGSMTMPQSISWSATGTHLPLSRTSVRWFVVL